MNMIKRTTSILIASLMLTGIFLNIGVYAISKQDDSTPYYFSKSFLTDYYLAIDQYKDISLSDDIASDNLRQYISNKINGKRHKLEVNGKDDMQNYTLHFTLQDSKTFDNFIRLTIFTDTKFNYKGLNVDSGYGEASQIILSRCDDSFKIEDWYIMGDYYDTEIRGELTEIINPDFWYNKSSAIIDIQNKQLGLNNRISSYYKAMISEGDLTVLDESDLTISDDSDLYKNASMSRATLYNLNKNNIMTYARNNCYKQYPASGNSNLVNSYYDFSTITGSYDCTNFVSHALLAGGAVVYDTGGSGISSTGWYFRNINNRSSSWSGVPNLYNFLTTNTTKGPVGIYVRYTGIHVPSMPTFPYNGGDIIQFYSTSYGNWRHSAIITGFNYMSGSSTTLEPLVTSRSLYGSYTIDERVSSTSYANEDKRIIKLTGYYQ